ncbi:PQQ-binding-like beta-propeller repeat protein [Cellulomonas sp. NS3]|uniref:outer membrane protein assembly factor BamB family protein n=1 Tax=Cellulomonas sp. NS3 TaxID=2973977 RepID=UPI0021626B5B|nr:PQQ-binding-like beta-propeller repeat protein [Cellulomonas sp. NS3]
MTGSLAVPWSEVWRAPREGVVGVIGDVLVLNDRQGGGVLGVGLDDGATRWEHPAGGTFGCWFVLHDGGTRDGRRLGPVNVLEPGSAVLACLDAIPFEGASFPNVLTGSDTSLASGPQSEISVLDPVSGALVRHLVLPGSGHPTEIDDGVVTMGLDGQGRLVGSRWSLRTGERAWEYTGPHVGRVGGVSLYSGSETMTWEAGEVSVTLDLRTGKETDPASGTDTPELDRFTLPDGGTAVTSAIDERVELVVADGDGTRRFTTAAHAIHPAVDDGSAARTLLVQPSEHDGIMAIDSRTGDELWSWPTWASPVVLAGRVVLRDQDRIIAVDDRTGATVWEHDQLAPESGGSIVTDGRVVLTQSREDAQSFLVARDVETGEQVWRIPSTLDGGRAQPLPDGRVLLSGSGQTALLGP